MPAMSANETRRRVAAIDSKDLIYYSFITPPARFDYRTVVDTIIRAEDETLTAIICHFALAPAAAPP